ncbi:DUF401 family protein [Thermogladius sp. 4427co]|uniref:DUF401 family protein n=1 Tax=Thermogladius sp. 4427co TaxID=3450718 RepID=UPI003F7A8BF0
MKIWFNAFNYNFLATLAALIASMYLAELFKTTEYSKKAVEALETLNPRLAAVGIPALVGLLPMPGGAYVSATLVDNVYRKNGLTPESKTFLNFWYRHIWITVWPLYQGVLIASYILGYDVKEITLRNLPIMVSSIVSGLPFVYLLMRKTRKSNNGRISDIIHFWPFAAIAILNLGLNLSVYASVTIVIAIYSIIYRVGLSQHKDALKYSLSPSIILLVVVSLIYGYAIANSNLAYEIGSFIKPVEAGLFTVTALVVIATGFEFTFSSIAFPVFKPYINTQNMFYGFLGGFVGSMLSPVHTCLVLSSEYFGSDLKKTYKYLIPATILSVVIAMLINKFY